MVSGCCVTCRNSEWLKPRTPFDRPDSGLQQPPGWTWVGTYCGTFLQPPAAILNSFLHTPVAGRGPRELSAAISARRERAPTTPRSHSACGAGVGSASARAPGPEPMACFQLGRRRKVWFGGADCTPVLMAIQVSGTGSQAR